MTWRTRIAMLRSFLKRDRLRVRNMLRAKEPNVHELDAVFVGIGITKQQLEEMGVTPRVSKYERA